MAWGTRTLRHLVRRVLIGSGSSRTPTEINGCLWNADITPREAYARLVAGDVESVSVDKLANRTAANAIMPYPPGIPMLMSGENFGGADSPQIGYLRGMQNREEQFPGFAGVIEGAEMTHGSYHVLCVK